MRTDSSRYRHMRITATLGPVTEGHERLATLMCQGVDGIRLDMADATESLVTELVERIRSTSDPMRRQVALMMNVKGPEMHTGARDAEHAALVGEAFDFGRADARPWAALLCASRGPSAGLETNPKVAPESLRNASMIGEPS